MKVKGPAVSMGPLSLIVAHTVPHHCQRPSLQPPLGRIPSTLLPGLLLQEYRGREGLQKTSCLLKASRSSGQWSGVIVRIK